MTRHLRRVHARLFALVAAVTGLLVAGAEVAGAKYRGSDVLGNLSPESLLGDGSLADRYPLSAYALDFHVDVGVSELSGVPPTIAHWASAQLWSLSSFLVRTVIDVFTWAFSLDLLAGSPDQAGDGAIGPVSEAISSLYENVIGEAWMVAAITLAGIWGIWKGLVQRRYSQTAASLAVSVCCVLVALFFVLQPERTVGQASQWANQLSLAFLSGASRGTVDDPTAAKRKVADQLFTAQVLQPWLALNFGGPRHCVDTDRLDDEDFPRPVSPADPAGDVCRDHLRQGKDGHGGYAPRFLKLAAGSDERDAEYEALKTGQTPEGDDQFRGYSVDKADAPAVDIQQAGGAYQRLTLAAVIFLGSLGMIFLLGFLALAVVLAQIVALVLLAFAPVALVVGVFPGAGHDLFRTWLTRLGTAVFIKALYSLVIAVVVTVSAALGSATANLGFLLAFGLQAVFFWALFLYRKQISARLVGATAGRYDAGPIRTATHRGAELASRPFSALTALPALTAVAANRQQSALGGDTAPPRSRTAPEDPPTPPESGSVNGGGPSNPSAPPSVRATEAPSPPPVTVNGNGRVATSGNGDLVAQRNGHTPRQTTDLEPLPPAPDSPEAAQQNSPNRSAADGQDVMRRARELRSEQEQQTRNGGPEETPR